MVRLIVALMLLCCTFSITAQPPFYSFDESFTLDAFQEVNPGIFTYQDYRLSIDETFTVLDNATQQVFTFIKQVSITGVLVLPGGRITVGGFLSGGGLGTVASLYAGASLIATQELWAEVIDPLDNTITIVNRNLVYANQTSSIIDKVIIRGVDSQNSFAPVLLSNLKVLLDIPGYSIVQPIKIVENGDDIFNFGGFFQATFEDDFEAFKVCADGSDSTLITLNFLDAILFPNQVIDFTALDWQLRIREDPLGEEVERFGKIIPKPSPQPNTIKLFRYQHPKHPPEEATDTIHLEVYDGINDLVLHQVPIIIFPPPVLMVHGLWGDRNSFKNMNDALIRSSRYDDFQLSRCDYKNSNDEEFETNKDIVKLCITGEDGLINQVLEKKIAVRKVDLVTHSMGGILSRLYIQSEDYSNNVNKFITIQTPHSGSQLANMLLDPEFSYRSAGFCTNIRFFQGLGRCDEGAVNDLRIDSDEIANLNLGSQPSIAKHAITSIIDFNEIPFDFKIMLEKQFMLNAALFAALFGGEPSDGIVSLSSQTGGLPANAISHFQKVLHIGAPESAEIINQVNELLLISPESESFTKAPFQRISQTYNPPASNDFDVQTREVEILQPLANTVHFVGDELEIEVRTPPESTLTLVSFKNGTGLSESKELQGNEGTVTFDINDGLFGKRRIGLMAYENNTLLGISYIDIFVDTRENPEKLVIKPTLGYFKLGQTKIFTILGYFNGSSAILNELPDLTYHFNNDNLLYKGENIIEAVTEGQTEMSVSFRGVESQPVSIIIEEADVNSSDNIIGKQSITRRLHVFPSPTSASINLGEIGPHRGSQQVRIFDQMGRRVFDQEFSLQQEPIAINVSNLSRGFYIVSVVVDGYLYSGKFIKQ